MDKLSRKDFIKVWPCIVAAGASIITGVNLEIGYGNNPYAMAARICNNMFDAEMSNDPQKIENSKKLAFVWLFAETAREYGKLVGYEKAGEALGHYMYGEGKSLDVSNWLNEDSKNEKDFWARILSNMRYGIVKEEKVDDNSAYRMLKARLKNGHTFIMEANSGDLFDAIGNSTCKMKADFQFRFDSENQVTTDKKLRDMHFELTDWYDWDGKKNPAELAYKGMDFASGFFGRIRTIMINDGELVGKMLHKLNLPSVYVDQLKLAYSAGVFSFFGKLSDSVSNVGYSLEESLTSGEGISEAEMALLEEVGAKQYQIYGRLYHPGMVSADE